MAMVGSDAVERPMPPKPMMITTCQGQPSLSPTPLRTTSSASSRNGEGRDAQNDHADDVDDSVRNETCQSPGKSASATLCGRMERDAAHISGSRMLWFFLVARAETQSEKGPTERCQHCTGRKSLVSNVPAVKRPMKPPMRSERLVSPTWLR